MSTEKGQKMTLKMSTEGNKIPLNFIMRVGNLSNQGSDVSFWHMTNQVSL